MTKANIQVAVQRWISGKAIVGKTMRDGIADLKDRPISIHLDELLKYGDVSGRTITRNALAAFREAVDVILPMHKVAIALVMTLDGQYEAERLLDSPDAVFQLLPKEPPELFIYPERMLRQLEAWLSKKKKVPTPELSLLSIAAPVRTYLSVRAGAEPKTASDLILVAGV